MEPPVYVEVFGATIAIPSENAQETAQLQAQWSRCRVEEPAPNVEVLQVTPHESMDRVRRHYSFVSEITHFGIQQLTGQELMLHAAGVADLQTGQVVALVAESGAGKTTASVRLCTNGFGYVSDETIAIDDHLRIRPYPKPLSVIIDSADPLHKSQHGPDELGMTSAPQDLRLGAIVLLDRDKHAVTSGPPTLEPIEIIDAVSQLIPQSSALPSMDCGLLRMTQAVEAVGGAHRLHYREIEEAAPLLRSLLERAAPHPSEILHHPPDQVVALEDRYAPVAVPTDRAAIDVVERNAYTDAIEANGSIELLVGSMPVRLTGIGPFVWRLCEQPMDRAGLLSECIREFGEHEQAAGLVQSAVDDMLASGVLRAADPAG